MNGLRLAVVGKGGAGKSFISATLARILARDGRSVAVLDADALPGAAISLGMGPIPDAMLSDAAQETIEGWRLKRGIGPATAVRRYAWTGPDGVRLLQGGKAGEQGLSGMWGSVHAFNIVCRRLAHEPVLRDWDLIGDLAAGARQTAQNRAPYASRYLVVVGPGAASSMTARRLVHMARSWGAEVGLIANRVEPRDLVALGRLDATVLGVVPPDESVQEADATGRAPIDVDPGSPAVQAVTELAMTLTRREETA